MPHVNILEEGCVRTGAICQLGNGGFYALGDLYNYGGPEGVVIFRHREAVATPPRDYINGIFTGWEHMWPAEGDLTITVAKSSHFQYFGYEGKQI